jgi:hypothetical protein
MRAARLNLTLAALLCLFPATLRADKVLLIGSGDPANQTYVQSMLQSQGDTVTIGPTFNNFTGAGLSGYNEVMLLPNGPWQSPYSAFSMGDMPKAGQQALVNYVNSGGGLVTSEWVLQKYTTQQDFQTLFKVLPMAASTMYTSNSPITFTALTANSVINYNLPGSFSFATGNSFGSETYYAPKAGATPYFATNQWGPNLGPTGTAFGVIGWNFGAGHVMSFSTPLDTTSLMNPNFAQLVSNAVSWAGGDPTGNPLGPPFHPSMGPNPPIDPKVPEPAAVGVWSTGLIAIAVLSWARRKKRSVN